MYFQIWNLWYYFLCFLLHFISWYKMVPCNPPISNLPHPRHHYHPIHLLRKLFSPWKTVYGDFFSFTSMLCIVIAASIHFFLILCEMDFLFLSVQPTKLSLFTLTTWCICDGEKKNFFFSLFNFILPTFILIIFIFFFCKKKMKIWKDASEQKMYLEFLSSFLW